MFNIITYIAIILITFIFTYIFNIRENYTLLYMLLIAPILDYIIFNYIRKKVKVTLNEVSETIEKREELLCTVSIENTGILPVPFLEYEFTFSNKFICGDEKYFRDRISLGCKSNINEEYNLFAAHRGLGNVRLSTVEIKSLLGLFKRPLDLEDYIRNVTIIPSLVNVDGVEDLLQRINDEDEYDEKTNNSFMGDPSYEFKEYAPGDPLNRVNWKLSSKRNTLMIRKSSVEMKLNKTIILDPSILERGNYEEREDILIEAVIGLAKEFFLLDYGVDILLCKDKSWEKIKFESLDGIPMMQKFFSIYNFKDISKLNKRFSNLGKTIERANDYIIFTGNKDMELRNFANILKEYGNSVTIISDNKSKMEDNEYYLHTDYRLERI